jgi:hypothetical protein
MKYNSVGPLRFIPPIRRALAVIAIVLSFVFALAAFGDPVNTSWTYQGQLRRSGAPYNGTCNFQFSLWDAASAGTQQASTQSINGVNVVNGLFTVVLDFDEQGTPGQHPFTGAARWLGTSVQCSGDGGFTPLDPRQPITAAPYALSLRPGAAIIGPGRFTPIGTGSALKVLNTEDNGVGVEGSTAKEGYGVVGSAAGGPNSAGVFGSNSNGAGIWGSSSGSGPAIYGQNTAGGYAGQFLGPVYVGGTLSATSGGNTIEGTGAIGVHGVSNGNTGTIGVKGEATGTTSVGLYGTASGTNSIGVLGITSASTAVYGQSTGSGTAIYGQALGTGLAGLFSGSVTVQGTLTKSAGSFRIDHPLDPANKFLSHSFVESPDMKNIYDGNVTTDASGGATVILPDYFEALNRDYRYQLTVLGQFAQAIVSRKIAGNSFEIRTDKPGVEVSWQVTGIRQDAYAKAKPIIVEESKPAEEQGMYLFPAGFGAGEEKRIGAASRPLAPQPEAKKTK